MPTTGTAPWWYVAALAGSFTILGGLITLASGWLSDRRKAKREDNQRWDRDLREAAARYLVETVKVQEYFSPNGPKPVKFGESDTVGIDVTAVYQAYYELCLVAPEQVHLAGKTLLKATNGVVAVGMALGDHKHESSAERFGMLALYNEARKDFTKSVKNSLRST